MKKLTESDALKFKTLSAEDKAKRGILGRLYGPVASFKSPTRNGRAYSQELWEKVFNSDLIKERFENGGIMGELTHPEDREEIAIDRVAIVMPEPPVKDSNGNLIAYVDILDTPEGRIAYQLAKYGYKFGISTRGTGDIIEGIDGDEVDPDTYQLNALDLVEIPAVKEARLAFVESLNTTKRYGKTLKESLKREMNKFSDKDKEIANESLHNLGINLEESISVDKDKYPFLADAISKDYVNIKVSGEKVTNSKFDETGMESAGLNITDVKNDIKRFAEHDGLEFVYDDNKSESLGESLNEKLVDPSEEDLGNFEEKVENAGFTISSKGRGLFGSFHYQIEKELDHDVSEDELMAEWDALMAISDELDETGIPMTANMGIPNDRPNVITAGVDVREKYVPDDAKLGEEFNPENVTSVMTAINNGIEDDEDINEIKHYLDQIVSHCQSIADGYDIKLDLHYFDESMNESTECGSDKSDEVVDDKSDEEEGSEILAELQEALARVKELEVNNLSLQEKLSVGNAKVSEVEEQLTKYKQATVRLSNSTIKVKKLNEELKKKDEIIAKNEKGLKDKDKIIEKLSKSELSANMKLGESEKELNELKATNKKLTENVNSLSEKFNKSQDLVGRYKKSYAALRESYLETKAQNYGLKVETIKQKLGESYKIKDIDSVCESLSKEKVNLGKLPFRVNENLKIGFKETEKVNNNPASDDYVSDSLRNMIL